LHPRLLPRPCLLRRNPPPNGHGLRSQGPRCHERLTPGLDTPPLSAKEQQAFDLLTENGTVSAGAMEDVFGPGQARHQGIYGLKKKLEPFGRTIVWSKADGYRLQAAVDG